ncbi:hypothetical protein ACFWUP_02200 [Nocardia sp. NPDC058658]|uniref:hypothetical protein n=1 Tax=Nocardia sp. NPDC058658 TaxID=3346580 RepID=UPI00364EE9DC
MSNDETATPTEPDTDSGADTAVEMTKVVESESAVDTEPQAAKVDREATESWWTGRSATVTARVGVAAVVCASLTTSVVLFVQNQHSNNLLRAQEQAREAACHYGPILADYDSKNLDTYFKAVLDGAVGDWKKQFESTSTELREVLTQGEVTSEVTDTQCAIRTADEDSAEAIVVIRQTITSLGTGHKPKPGQLAMVLSLRNDNGSWLVEKVNSPTPPTQAQ